MKTWLCAIGVLGVGAVVLVTLYLNERWHRIGYEIGMLEGEVRRPKREPLVVPIGHGSIATILEPLGFTVDLTDYTHRPRWGGGSDGNVGA